MTVTPTPDGRRTRLLLLRVVGAAALAVSAWVHVDLASGPLVTAEGVTLAGLFVGQAVVAGVAALAVLLVGGVAVWAAAGVVAFGSLVALVLSVYVAVPAVGPFPSLYEPLWYGEKAVAAAAAGVATVAAAVALVPVRTAPRGSGGGTPSPRR